MMIAAPTIPRSTTSSPTNRSSRYEKNRRSLASMGYARLYAVDDGGLGNLIENMLQMKEYIFSTSSQI